jgi:hypothetical protein
VGTDHARRIVGTPSGVEEERALLPVAVLASGAYSEKLFAGNQAAVFWLQPSLASAVTGVSAKQRQSQDTRN